MQQFISRALPATTLIRTLMRDGALLHFPPNLGVAFPHSHLQEDKGKVRKTRQERRTRGNIVESVTNCIFTYYKVKTNVYLLNTLNNLSIMRSTAVGAQVTND